MQWAMRQHQTKVSFRWNTRRIAEFETERGRGTLASRVQFRRNLEVTNALLGSVTCHALMSGIIVVLCCPAPLLSAYGLIGVESEYLLTTLVYPLLTAHATLHPVLTTLRHNGLRSQSRKLLRSLRKCQWHSASIEQAVTTVSQTVAQHTVTAGRAHKEQDRHFQMLQGMWGK